MILNRTLKIVLLSVSLFLVFELRSQAVRPIQQGVAQRIDDAALREANSRKGDWITHGRTYDERRFSPLDQINLTSVKRLALAWFFDAQTTRGLEATPLVVDGVLYTTGNWSVVYALDARTGKQIWRHDPQVPRQHGSKACCDVVNRGVAIYRGKVFAGTLDGRLVALDARTGSPVWEVATVDPAREYTITGAPRVIKGKVVIGNGGAEYGVRGYVSAYDAETGRRIWRSYTVPGDPSQPFESKAMEMAARTWKGEWWKIGGGGTAWDSMAYDPELDLLYVGTGNGSPWNANLRSKGGGDNLFLSSILALRPDSGELVWHYQVNPGDSWDYTATQHMILADLVIGGRDRKVLMQAPKNGFFYVLDRKTGKLISAEPIVGVTWAKAIDKSTGRPQENPGVRYESAGALIKPGPLGAHNWQPMSFSPKTGLVYIPAQEASFYYSQATNFQYRPGFWNTGVGFGTPPAGSRETPRGHLLAWDPIAQVERWRVPYQIMWNGGTLATAGDLVFQGTGDGRVVAYGAEKGELLWEFKYGAGIIGSPVTYELDGIQYLTIMAGWGGAGASSTSSAPQQPTPGRVLTFALDGTAKLPMLLAANPVVPPAIEFTASKEAIDQGRSVYAQHCAICHGQSAGGGSAPDLRRSAAAIFEAYPKIVLEGSLVTGGMPSFKQVLKPAEVEAIRFFILSRRAELSSAK